MVQCLLDQKGPSDNGPKRPGAVWLAIATRNESLAGSHERLSRADNVQPGSNRSFGITFAVAFGIIALLPLWRGNGVMLWALACSAAFLIAAFLFPSFLAPLNRMWFRFGLLLHRVVSPVVLGLMFFAFVTPFAFVVRLLGAKLLALGNDKSAQSYWKRRAPPGPAPETVRNQF